VTFDRDEVVRGETETRDVSCCGASVRSPRSDYNLRQELNVFTAPRKPR
jgi:hypothetical protein